MTRLKNTRRRSATPEASDAPRNWTKEAVHRRKAESVIPDHLIDLFAAFVRLIYQREADAIMMRLRRKYARKARVKK